MPVCAQDQAPTRIHLRRLSREQVPQALAVDGLPIQRHLTICGHVENITPDMLRFFRVRHCGQFDLERGLIYELRGDEEERQQQEQHVDQRGHIHGRPAFEGRLQSHRISALPVP